MESILSSIIVAVCSIISVVLTNLASNTKIQQDIKTHQAVTDTKIENLTSEVRKHNNFATRVPVLEEQLRDVKERVERLEDNR